MNTEFLEKVLSELKKPNVVIIVKNEYDKERIITIGADTRYEHELTPLAIEFKNILIAEISKRLSNVPVS